MCIKLKRQSRHHGGQVKEITDMLLESTCRSDYFPIPLATIPPDCLTGMDIYLEDNQEYSLHSPKGTKIEIDEYKAMIDNNVSIAYAAMKDHDKFYTTLEKYLIKCIITPGRQNKKINELLYWTTLELARQLVATQSNECGIKHASAITEAIVEKVTRDKNAFLHLFEVSSHDNCLATHLANTCIFAAALADHMKITDKEFLKNLAMGAFIHDIGKMFIPTELLDATHQLSSDEFGRIAKHVELGHEHLLNIANIPETAMEVLLQHHEKLDGSGYPNGLMGDEISLAGKIMAVIDAFDAMTSLRPFRGKTYSTEKALGTLIKYSPEKYDPNVVKCFVDMIQKKLLNSIDKNSAQWHIPDITDEGHNGIARRKHLRHFFRKCTYIHPIHKVNNQVQLGDGVKITISNISRSGIGFISQIPADQGENYYISISEDPNSTPVKVIAEITNCTSHENGCYTVGAKFYNLQSAKTLNSFIKTKQDAHLEWAGMLAD